VIDRDQTSKESRGWSHDAVSRLRMFLRKNGKIHRITVYLVLPRGKRAYLEVNDDKDDDDSRDEVADVGRVLAVESLLDSEHLVGLGEEEVEQGDDGTLELSTLLSSDRDGRKGLPQDDLADVGGDEEGDTGAETVALLKELVKKDNDDSSEGELHDDEDTVDKADLVDVTVHAGKKVCEGFADGDDDREKFLGGLEKLSVLLGAHLDVNDLGTRKELHDHGRGDDWGDTKLHKGSLVGGKDDSEPVKRVSALHS
jgi:hypothetical protein